MQKNDLQLSENKIQRLRKDEMSTEIPHHVKVVPYGGQSNPPMPVEMTLKTPVPLKFLCRKLISQTEARTKDFNFLKDVLFVEQCPEYNGYITLACRDKENIKSASSAKYLPLIDMTPAHPDTVMTA